MTQDPRYPAGSRGNLGASSFEGSPSSSGDRSGFEDAPGFEDSSTMQGQPEPSMTEKMQDKASNVGSKIQEQADVTRETAAGGLEKTADQMRDRLADKGGVQGQVGTKIADGLERTAVYLREHETEQIWNDVEKFVNEHPLQSAAGAAVAGFVIARVLR